MSKRQGAGPSESNTVLVPPKAKKPKVVEKGESSVEKPEEEPSTSKPKKISPRPGPSSAPDNGAPEQDAVVEPLQIYGPPTEDDDSSSQCSSYTQALMELGQTRSVEEMDVDDPSLMTVDSASDVEREEKYRLDWTGSRM